MFKSKLGWILANIELPKSMRSWPVWKLNKLFKRRRKVQKFSNRYNREIKKWFKDHPEIIQNYNQLIKDLDAGDLPF